MAKRFDWERRQRILSGEYVPFREGSFLLLTLVLIASPFVWGIHITFVLVVAWFLLLGWVAEE
jgi:hypothetical protein